MSTHNKMNMTTRSLRMVLCAVAGVVGLSGCTEDVPPKPIRPVLTMVVGDTSNLKNRPFTGRASAAEQANLSFRIGGPLIELAVKVGDKVSAGDLIARIDPNDFQVQLNNVTAQLESIKAAYTAAENDFQRVASVQREDPGATSQRAVDISRATRDQARAQVAAIQALVQASNDRLHYTELLAPFSGTIVATYSENFEDVLPKQRVARLLNASRIKFLIDVPETMISLSPYVETIEIGFDAIPDRTFPAIIQEIGTEANYSTRTFPVTLIMDQPIDVKVLPGMAGEASITARLPEEAVKAGFDLPASAVFSNDQTGNTFIWVVDESAEVVTKRQVEVSGISSFGMHITSGLETGDRVVVAGVHFLSEGQKIRIMAADGDSGAGA